MGTFILAYLAICGILCFAIVQAKGDALEKANKKEDAALINLLFFPGFFAGVFLRELLGR